MFCCRGGIVFLLLLATSTQHESTICGNVRLGVAGASSASGGVDLGTTLVAIKFRDGVVVGADTRTSSGGVSVSHATAHKIVPLTAQVVVARSGSAAATQHLAHQAYVTHQNRWHRYDYTLSTSQLAHWFRDQVYEQYQKEDSPSVSLLVVGYDCDDERARIFSVLPSGAILEQGNYASEGSGSRFALGFLDQSYPSSLLHKTNTFLESDACSQLSEQAAIDLCRRAIEGSILRDGASGGLIRMYVLTANGRREITQIPQLFGLDSNNGKDLRGFALAVPWDDRKQESQGDVEKD